ncbi:cold-shock protein [Fodinibius sp. AD559]|uniref:cold-shock protein n=1 Tax=Fodinibius sp. AD559 TaxID=3424179 RepID=UPI0040469908
MIQQGKIKFFDAQKGFGFINPDEGNNDIFVHRNNIEDLGFDQGFDDGESVEFEVEETDKGLSAINVRSLN